MTNAVPKINYTVGYIKWPVVISMTVHIIFLLLLVLAVLFACHVPTSSVDLHKNFYGLLKHKILKARCSSMHISHYV